MNIEEKIIFQGNTNGYDSYRIPGMILVQDALLLTCEARVGGMGDWGDIDILVVRLEKDGSLTEVFKVGESEKPQDGTMRTYNNPVLVPDMDRVHLIYHKNYEQAFIVTSEDEGRTWSKAREITETFKSFPCKWNVCATGPGHGVKMDSGRLVAPIWLADGEVYEDGMRKKHWPSVAGCIYSDDHGVTWKAGALTKDICDANETSIAQLKEDYLLFNFRNRGEDHRRILGISVDGGETFERQWIAEELIDPMCMGGMTSNGDKVFFVNCNTEKTRTNLKVKCSKDEGTTWEDICDVDSVGGYADIVVHDEKIVIFYEHTVGDRITELVLKSISY